MLYCFLGDDPKIRQKAFSLSEALRKKRENAAFLKVSENDDFNFDEILNSQGLFYDKYIVFFDNLQRDFTESEVKLMSESKHVFVFVSDKIKPSLEKWLKKYADKVASSEKSNLKTESETFKFVDKVLEKKFSYPDFFRLNLQEEKLMGALFWGFKNLYLAKTGELKGSSFVVRKFTNLSAKWTKEEIEEKLFEVSTMQIKAFKNNKENYLEEFILQTGC